MNKHSIMRYLLTCFILLTAGNTSAQLITKAAITKAWDTMTEFTREATEAIPERDYRHKFDKETREFDEYLTHLIVNIHFQEFNMCITQHFARCCMCMKYPAFGIQPDNKMHGTV